MPSVPARPPAAFRFIRCTVAQVLVRNPRDHGGVGVWIGQKQVQGETQLHDREVRAPVVVVDGQAVVARVFRQCGLSYLLTYLLSN